MLNRGTHAPSSPVAASGMRHVSGLDLVYTVGMRHVALILFSAVVMAETPKPAPTLNTAERIAIQALMAESKRLSDAQAELSKQYAEIQAELCRKHYEGKPCEVAGNGTVVLKPEPPKPEVKK